MLRQIKIFIILIIISLSMGCFNQKMDSVSDCERIKNELKRDRCLISFIEDVPWNNTDLRIEICNRTIDTEMRDTCFFKIARDGWRAMPPDTLINLCEKIISDTLRKSCEDIEYRHHLYVIR